MERVDRYLKSVGTYLPKEQKENILRELSENIRSEIEDKEAELGRPLTAAEQEAVVKHHGNPLLVAGRYRQDQRSVAFGRQWIGPELFPFYMKVLSFNLGLTSVVILALFTGLFAAGQHMTVSGLVGAMLMQFLIQGGIITVIFATVNTHLTKYPDRWDPRKPGHLQGPQFAEDRAHKNGQRVSRVESVSQFIALAVSVVWLRTLNSASYLVLGPATAKVLTLSPTWHQAYWPMVLVALAGMIQSGINLFYPNWVIFRSWMRMGMNAASLAIVYFLIRSRVWVTLTVPDGTVNYHERPMAMLNQSIFYGLLIAALILIGMLIVDVRRLVRMQDRERTEIHSR
jgi:hypothetical protein